MTEETASWNEKDGDGKMSPVSFCWLSNKELTILNIYLDSRFIIEC